MKTNKWKSVPIDTSDIPLTELANLGGVEELSDYEILRPEDSGSVNKKKRKAKKCSKVKKKFKTAQEKAYDLVFNKDAINEMQEIESENEGAVDTSEEIDMSGWSNCSFHSSILYGLKDLGFQKPTKIQELTIPAAIRGSQDILGAAETGSGKTLAFGIPIVNSILSIKESRKEAAENSFGIKRPLYCLILTPTRELAIQIKKHLQAVCKYTDIMTESSIMQNFEPHCDTATDFRSGVYLTQCTDPSEGFSGVFFHADLPVPISVVVGGMAPEKQKRILRKGPEIVIATPGRLWELIEEGEDHVSHVSNIRYLVIDEADRMVEKGHFAELTQILNLINGNESNRKRQTFVFSATLTLVHDIPNRLVMKNKKGKMQQKQKLDSLVKLTGMKDPKIIDITKKTAVVESLTETQIMCSNEDKDSYLYYFLKMHPGRTLVFCNSIDCVRRLRTVLEHLHCNPLPLHASMHQRQRLKNLEKFEQSGTGVLLATDVAARGLDIKGIEHVIHFQVPRTAETYVHRSGRTARALNEGLSLVLIEPQDAVYYRKICKTLNKDKALPTFPVDHKVFSLAKERVTLSRAIDKSEHQMKRLEAQNRWFKNTAEAMDVDIEDENLLTNLGDAHEQAAQKRKINFMKKQLDRMLSRPIISKIFAGSYPTKSGKLISPSLYEPQKAVTVAKGVTVAKKFQKKKKFQKEKL